MGFFMMNWWTFRNTVLWYHFVLLYNVFIRNIRIFETVDFVFKEHLSCTVAVCRYIFERLSSTCVTKRYTAVLFVTRFMFILFGVGPASHTSSALLGSTWCQLYSSSVLSWNLIFHARLCCISTWCHDMHLLRALQELHIYVCHAVYFYMMSAVFTYYALSRNLIFYARQCCIFLRDVIDINLLWAVQELDILCATVLYISTWCHWRPSTVSTRGTWDFMCVSVICQRHDFITHSGCREKYTCYIDAVYISTLCSTSLCFIMLSDGAYFHRGFSHGMCIFWRIWCWVSLMTAWCRTVIFECEYV